LKRDPARSGCRRADTLPGEQRGEQRDDFGPDVPGPIRPPSDFRNTQVFCLLGKLAPFAERPDRPKRLRGPTRLTYSPDDDPFLLEMERRVRVVADSAMRRERLLGLLEKLEPDHSYAVLESLLERPGTPSPHLHDLRLVLQDVLRAGGATRPLPSALRDAWQERARAAGDAFLERLLGASGAAEMMANPASALHRDVAGIPLGVRRSLARGMDARVLEKLLLDPDPIVLDHLLRNPRLTEEHVVRIAARRPISETALRALADSVRFGVRPRVRVAIARNPYCPTDLALRLVGTLPLTVLREMRADGTLDTRVRTHVGEEILRRGRSE